MRDDIAALLELSHEIGREDRDFAILGEGNTSVRLSATQFAVKASGARLATLTEADVTVCDTAQLATLLERKNLPDAVVEKALLDARVDPAAKKPSIEAIFHAWLLTLDGVGFVGHCHPVTLNQILCSPRARDFAEHRMFPDEIVFCGSASVYVPYADPGLPLAWQIRERTKDFLRDHGVVPKLILLQNHGVIALGGSPQAVLACLLMAGKAAAIFAGAAAMGGPTFLLPQHVERITTRPDEAYRQGRLAI
jgi:rhamnose utilization protein RhaD (predicted bifunctional aldolase and dehydrogenase)